MNDTEKDISAPDSDCSGNGSLIQVIVNGGTGIAEITLPSGAQFFTKRDEVTRVPVPFGQVVGISPLAIK